MTATRLATCITILASTATTLAQVEEVRLTPNNPITSDILGYSVGFDGDVLIAGAPFGSEGGFMLAGRAFVFERVDGQWTQTRRLRASNRQSNAFFGVVSAVDNGTIVVAAGGEDAPQLNAGAVYVFEHNGIRWAETQRLRASDRASDDRFGFSIAIDGDTMLIGAAGDSHSGFQLAGSVYVFERNEGTWSEVDKLTASDPALDDNFGSAIALEGDRAVIGAFDDDHSDANNPGAVYVFEKNAGNWQEVTKLVASDPGNGSLFGGAIDLAGDTFVVGAEQHSHGGMEEAGAAYVFQRENGTWSEVARLVRTNPEAFDRYGCDVAIDGRTILVGAHLSDVGTRTGAVFAYWKVNGQWEFNRRLSASDPGNTNFGWRFGLHGNEIAIAGPFFQTNQGAIYMFGDALPCPGDADGDGETDVSDLAILLQNFKLLEGATYEQGDFDADGDVDLSDLAILIAQFGAACP